MKKMFTLFAVASAFMMNAQITISQVYGAGGNTGAVYNQDYVVLFNKTGATVDISGWSLQYGAATSTANWTGKVTFPANTTIAAYSYYLVGCSTGNGNGIAIPTVDFDASNQTTYGMSMAASNGKVALMNNSTTINGSTPSGAIDFVGFGTANAFETAAAPAPSATTAIFRANGGCTDTNNNNADFSTATPAPLNSSAATNNCSTLAVSDVKNTKSANFVRNTFVKNNEITFGADVKDVKIFNMLGQVVKKASVRSNETINVSDLVSGDYIVTGTINNQPVSQKILKD